MRQVRFSSGTRQSVRRVPRDTCHGGASAEASKENSPAARWPAARCRLDTLGRDILRVDGRSTARHQSVNCLHPIIWTMPRKFFTPRIVLLTFAIAALPVVCLAAKDFVMPTPQAAKSYPAHDDHPTEKVSVAVDPYDMADKASIFSVRYEDVGYMPIFVVVTNDGDQPVALSDMKAQLLTVNHSKLFPASVEDLYRRLSRPSTSGKPNP